MPLVALPIGLNERRFDAPRRSGSEFARSAFRRHPDRARRRECGVPHAAKQVCERDFLGPKRRVHAVVYVGLRTPSASPSTYTPKRPTSTGIEPDCDHALRLSASSRTRVQAVCQVAGRHARASRSRVACTVRNRYRRNDRGDAAGEDQVDERGAACEESRIRRHSEKCRPARRQAALRYRSPAGLSGFAARSTSGFNLRKLFSPMPLTFISSSIFLKPPLFCR